MKRFFLIQGSSGTSCIVSHYTWIQEASSASATSVAPPPRRKRTPTHGEGTPRKHAHTYTYRDANCLHAIRAHSLAETRGGGRCSACHWPPRKHGRIPFSFMDPPTQLRTRRDGLSLCGCASAGEQVYTRRCEGGIRTECRR